MNYIPIGIMGIVCVSSIVSGIYQAAALVNNEWEGQEHKALRSVLLVANVTALVSSIGYQTILYNLK